MERIAEVVRVQSIDADTVCPFCRDPLTEVSDDAARCALCGTAHHPGCWEENGRICSVFHCSGNQRRLDPLQERWLAPVCAALLAAPVVLFLWVCPYRVLPDYSVLPLLMLLAALVRSS